MGIEQFINMAFVISKPSSRKGSLRELYYLVENYREDGKVKRKTICKLKEHRNIDEAINALERQKQPFVEKMKKLKQDRELARQGKCPYYINYPPYLQEQNVVGRMAVVYADMQKYEEQIIRLEKIKEKYNL